MTEDKGALRQRLAKLTPAQRQLLWDKLGAAAAERDVTAESPQARDAEAGPCALSFAQERFWLADRFQPGSPVHNIALALHLNGELDIQALDRSLAEIVRRHESLRTTIRDEAGEPWQVVAPAGDLRASAGGLPLTVLTLRGSPAEHAAELARLLAQEAHRPFNLALDPLLRAALFRITAQEHTLLIVVHHIIFDAWSQTLFLSELAALYAAFSAGRPSPLPDLPLQYADFTLWQRRRLAGPLLEEQLSYWRRQLRGAPPLALPADRDRPATTTGLGGAERCDLTLAAAAWFAGAQPPPGRDALHRAARRLHGAAPPLHGRR